MEKQSKIAELYLAKLQESISVFPTKEIVYLANTILARRTSGTIFIAGNGGSALTASHMATDFGVGSIRRNNPVRAISLADNVGVISATANDISFDEVFSQQLQLLGKESDILIVFSASGNSPNIIKVVEKAIEMKIFTVAITGFDGGVAKKLADLSIHLPTDQGSYGIVEDLHSAISHMVTEIIRASE
jgi:D-sedoheptulose 7-phosphate isomerase